MKRVLYLSNIQVPYRVRFFNELAKHCHLTVFYQSRGCQSRDKTWAEGEKPNFLQAYPRDIPYILRQRYDEILVGCYNFPMQIFLMGLFRLRGLAYDINLDGEPFLEEKSWKNLCKKLLLSGARGYFVAGAQAAQSLKKLTGEKNVYVYNFSSLTQVELTNHRRASGCCRRKETVLVIGQYFPYKGLDIALKAAAMDPKRPYLFVGMGNRTEKLVREHPIPSNVGLIPFLQKQELEALYQSCGLLVLPSRKECWGLVINEAASFGMPIVSTWGSGAAVEFLGETYPQYLAVPGDGEDLHRCIQTWFSSGEKEAYRDFLLEKSQKYHIEQNVQTHVQAIYEVNHGQCHHPRL